MIHYNKYLTLLTFILVSCSQQTKTNKDAIRQVRVDDTRSGEHLINKLNISKSWTEITFVNNLWAYSIPCHSDRELQTIELTKVDNQEAVIWNTGTEEQWYALKKINTQGDSLVFETILPYDTTAVVLFTFKHVDKDKNIVRWGVEGTSCTYIPMQDTSKYTKIQQPCNDDEK
jgi:hypothetical protein